MLEILHEAHGELSKMILYFGMINILKKIFEANPGESFIEFIEQCSGCGQEIIVKTTPTSGGYGLQGGVLFKSSSSTYKAMCSNCYKKQESAGHTYGG